MRFTYNAYKQLITSLKDREYVFSDYLNYSQYEYAVILRHDIDMDIERALDLAKLEASLGVKSTYYVLISSDFYNAFSKKNIYLLQKIKDCGHDIGLHFDEEKYEKREINVPDAIEKELDILESFLGGDSRVISVSMHRPSQQTLDSNYVIRSGNVINSYGAEFFKNFKYISDSRRNWREDVLEIVNQKQYNRLHILTHPIWYYEEEKDVRTVLKEFCHQKVFQCYESLSDNIRDLGSILAKKDL